ncbi:MAG TPA: ASCH domain-containing protein [Planctomycetaceae bacterium]|nr:ASCH domain-containing protein [Planctomycetaceae bacterium]
MNYYIQYHNVENEGLLIANPPFSRTNLGIYTRLAHAKNADGRVFLIAGVGKPRRYFLWSAFQIEKVKAGSDGIFQVNGTGWQLAPPQELKGKSFDSFRSACANFVGFRQITDLPYTKILNELAEDHRPPGDSGEIAAFFKQMRTLVKNDSESLALIDHVLGSDEPTRALSIRQPHAEAIMRGVKKIEYRSGPTKIREKIFVYASLGRYSAADEADMMQEYGIDDMACDDLPRGVIIGTVELYDCDEGDWRLRKPVRAATLRKPKGRPQPVWFKPF